MTHSRGPADPSPLTTTMSGMQITTRDQALQGEPMEPGHFTGPATSHPIHAAADPVPVRVGVVRFDAGVRNHWHRHGGGQVLLVVEGEGWVQARGETPSRIALGDTVAAPPGEEHWHGAGSEGPMSHVAISMGDITWLESSEGEPTP